MKILLVGIRSSKVKNRILSFLSILAVFFLVSCSSDKIAGGSSSTETGDEISLTGRVIDKGNAPTSGVVVTLAKAGISDTTDLQGKYHIEKKLAAKGLAKSSADSILDTLVFKQNGQKVSTYGVTKLIDSLPDVKIIQRDISGNLLPSSLQIGKVIAVLSGDGIPAGQPLMAEFFYNPLSNNYSGFIYFPAPSSLQNFSVYINVYDTSSHFIGRSQTVPFNSLAGNITIPGFNPGNAIPVAYAGKDTILPVNSLLALHGTVVDSFGGTISKWQWDIGGVGNFKTTSTGDTAIVLPPAPNPKYLCILKVTDNDGNISRSDTLAVKSIDVIPPTAPTVSAPASPTNNPKPTWTWIPKGGGNGTYRYRLDNPDLSTSATTTTTTSFSPASNLADGSHTLCVQESDTAGNWSTSGCASLTLDATPPIAPTVSVTPISPTINLRPTWSWLSGGGGNGTYRIKLDDSALTTGATQTTALSFTPTSDLAYGYHSLYVQERDSVGNWSLSGTASIAIISASAQQLVAVGDSGTILKTSNGGATWTIQASGTTSSLKAVQFVNANTGWAVGDNGVIVKTIDGGNTWSLQTSGTKQGLIAVHFVNVNSGLVVASTGDTIVRTTNGGSTWSVNKFTTSGVGGPGTLTSVYFLDSARGWFTTNNFLFRTTDGGASWAQETGKGFVDITYSVYFVNANTGWVAAAGAIYNTKNGDSTWTRKQMTGTFKSVYFLDVNKGYVVDQVSMSGGVWGIIQKTFDGGSTWTTQSFGMVINNQINTGARMVYFADANTGWVVGAGYDSPSDIYMTADGGAHWTPQNSITGIDLGTKRNLNSITLAR